MPLSLCLSLLPSPSSFATLSLKSQASQLRTQHHFLSHQHQTVVNNNNMNTLLVSTFPSSHSSLSNSSLSPLSILKHNNHIKITNLSLPRITIPSKQANSFRFSLPGSLKMQRQRRGVVCFAATPFSPETLQWISAISSVVLMLAKGTAIQKSFLVPLFALQAPISVISWIKGEYGTWTALLALLVRLFYFIPGELELPFLAMLLVIIAPYQTMNLRGTEPGGIISLVIAAYLAFQHFSRAGSLRRAFDQGSIIATIAVICITCVPCLLLF